MFYDDSISESLADSIHKVLGKDGAVAMFKVQSTGDINSLLSEFPAKDLGYHFMTITGRNMVEEFISKSKSQGLHCVDCQWLHVVTDTTKGDSSMSRYISMAQEGSNLAFVFDTSTPEGDDCSSGILCSMVELIRSLAINFENVLLAEMPLFSQVS